MPSCTESGYIFRATDMNRLYGNKEGQQLTSKTGKEWGIYTRTDTKKNDTNPIAWEPRVRGERQTDGYRICSDLSQCYKAQLDRFTQYKWTHLQI
jgi:hypothetical protein